MNGTYSVRREMIFLPQPLPKRERSGGKYTIDETK